MWQLHLKPEDPVAGRATATPDNIELIRCLVIQLDQPDCTALDQGADRLHPARLPTQEPGGFRQNWPAGEKLWTKPPDRIHALSVRFLALTDNCDQGACVNNRLINHGRSLPCGVDWCSGRPVTAGLL
jgi:hypothetical protein